MDDDGEDVGYAGKVKLVAPKDDVMEDRSDRDDPKEEVGTAFMELVRSRRDGLTEAALGPGPADEVRCRVLGGGGAPGRIIPEPEPLPGFEPCALREGGLVVDR